MSEEEKVSTRNAEAEQPAAKKINCKSIILTIGEVCLTLIISFLFFLMIIGCMWFHMLTKGSPGNMVIPIIGVCVMLFWFIFSGIVNGKRARILRKIKDGELTDKAPLLKINRIYHITKIIEVSFVCILMAIYFIFLFVEKSRFNKAYSKIEKWESSIVPHFTEDEDSKGNGAAYLRHLGEAPGLEKCIKKIIKNHRDEDLPKRRAAIHDWLKTHPYWIQNVSKLKTYDRFNFTFDLTKMNYLALMEKLIPVKNVMRINCYLLIELARNGRIREYMIVLESIKHVIERSNQPLVVAGIGKASWDAMLTVKANNSLIYIKDDDILNKVSGMLSEDIFSSEYLSSIMKGQTYWTAVNSKSNKLEDTINVFSFFPHEAIKDNLFFYGISKLLSPYLWNIKANWLEKMIETVEMVDIPNTELKECISVIERKNSYSDVLNKYLFPEIFLIIQESYRSRCRRPCLSAVIQVHKYYREKGKLPDSLMDIKYYQNKGIPKDPWAGLPLLYKKFDDPLCFRIKETGEDGKDSGEWLQPEEDPDTGKYRHQGFGWISCIYGTKKPIINKQIEEYIYGIDYYKE